MHFNKERPRNLDNKKWLRQVHRYLYHKSVETKKVAEEDEKADDGAKLVVQTGYQRPSKEESERNRHFGGPNR